MRPLRVVPKHDYNFYASAVSLWMQVSPATQLSRIGRKCELQDSRKPRPKARLNWYTMKQSGPLEAPDCFSSCGPHCRNKGELTAAIGLHGFLHGLHIDALVFSFVAVTSKIT